MEEEIPQQDQAQGYIAPQVATTALPLRSILNVSSWFLLFLLAPATILVLISQNTIPGNFFYPVKRGLENTVLAVASVNPTTKAFFRVDLQARRFLEAEKLLLAKADAAALSDFITEIQETQAAVAQVSDPVKKQELQEKVKSSYSEYEKRLVAVRMQLETKQQIPPSESTQPRVIPSPTAQPTNTPVPIPTTRPGDRPAPTPLPTRAPLPSNGAVASSTPPPPTAVPTEIPPIPVSPTGGLPQQPANTGGAVDATIAYLQCLQTRPAHECVPPPTTTLTPQPTPTTQPEREQRGRQTREERGESEGRHGPNRREPRSAGQKRD